MPGNARKWDKDVDCDIADEGFSIIITSKYPITQWQLCLGGNLKQ
jgi:hypothetical protein